MKTLYPITILSCALATGLFMPASTSAAGKGKKNKKAKGSRTLSIKKGRRLGEDTGRLTKSSNLVKGGSSGAKGKVHRIGERPGTDVRSANTNGVAPSGLLRWNNEGTGTKVKGAEKKTGKDGNAVYHLNQSGTSKKKRK